MHAHSTERRGTAERYVGRNEPLPSACSCILESTGGGSHGCHEYRHEDYVEGVGLPRTQYCPLVGSTVIIVVK